MEYREEDDQGVGDRGDRDSDAEALDLKNPHKWKDALKQRLPWQPQRRMIARWWKQQQVIEIIISRVREGRKGKRESGRKDESVLTEDEREYLREEREEESRLRAKGAVRRRLLTIGADHLLTLTYRENMTEVGRAEKDLRLFLKLVRERYPEFPYVAVWERQKRGAIHWHLGVVEFQDVRFLRSCWLEVVGEGNGNIDVRGPRGGKSSCVSLARYIAKYILKGQEERRRGQHRYRCSVGIVVPKETYMLGAVSLEQAVDVATDLIKELLGVVRPIVFVGGELDDWAFIGGYA